jgi:SAM-dependent methyltransferase
MVIERFLRGPGPVYARARERGRMLPDGLRYVESWVEEEGRARCFQLMETDDPRLLREWAANWDDLVDFEFIPVIGSSEAAAAENPRTNRSAPDAIANRQGLTRSYSDETWRLYAALKESLDPRGLDSLFDVAREYLGPEPRILDAGCRDCAHLIRLVQAHGGSGVGIDPVELHIQRAQEAIAGAGLTDRVTALVGVMHALPYPDEHFDFIWCRDVVEQVDNLPAALRECARVLKRDGHMLVYTVFASDLLSPKEAEMMGRTLADVPENLDEARVERAFADAGFTIERKDVVGTEWREYDEERTQPVSESLLQLSRLRRRRDELIAQFGQDVYDHVEAHLHWFVFILLGKLVPTIYVLGRE